MRILFLILCLCGCTEKKTVDLPKPAESKATTTPESDLVIAQTYYRDNRLPEAITHLDKVLSKNTNDSDALLYKGLSYLKSGSYKEASNEFSKIPEKERSLMAESCVEIQSIHKTKPSSELVSMVSSLFPDCAQDLNGSKDKETSVRLSFTKEEILKLGRLYEQAISKDEQEELKRQKEEKFQRDYNLNDAQLNEVTTRYLEFLAEEGK